MHPSSLENMQICYERYVKSRSWAGRDVIEVYDIGGANVNGNYSDIFSSAPFKYYAVDIAPQEGVDIVLEDPYKLPFNDNSIDILISGQVFEHVEYFWLLITEMIRVLKSDGMLILISPSSGPIHRYPVDCYRFHPDAYVALAKYTNSNLLYLKHDNRGQWRDLVGIFTKDKFSSTDFCVTNNWPLNRYEQENLPAEINIPNKNPDVDITTGEVGYLDLLRSLHDHIQPALYVEIGVKTGKSLILANKEAIGIDPLPKVSTVLSQTHMVYKQTSDDFFDSQAQLVFNNKKIDFAFIDGMHLFEFVLRDFINIEKYSHNKTVVVIDDIYPNNIIQAQRKRESQTWAGDVWKMVYCLKERRKDLGLVLFNTHPTGLLMVTGLNSSNRDLTNNYNDIVSRYKQLDMSPQVQKEIFSRSNSTSPTDTTIFNKIDNFLRK